MGQSYHWSVSVSSRSWPALIGVLGHLGIVTQKWGCAFGRCVGSGVFHGARTRWKVEVHRLTFVSPAVSQLVRGGALWGEDSSSRVLLYKRKPLT